MFNTLKINTALLIIGAFIFKVLFLNVAIIYHSPGIINLSKQAFTNQKRRSKAESTVSSPTTEQAVWTASQEAVESEDDTVKLKAPVFLLAFLSLFKAVLNSLKSDAPFDLFKYNLHSKKYLALSVLRI